MELVLPGDVTSLLMSLVGDARERCAILYTFETGNNPKRLLVNEFQFPEECDYAENSFLSAELAPDFVARVTKRARAIGAGLVFAHTHPGGATPEFSPVDDGGEKHLAKFLAHRLPDNTHAALVLSSGGVRARQLGTRDEMRVVSVGAKREVLFDPSTGHDRNLEHYDRQIRIFGIAAQEALGQLRVAVIGLGGTGSIVTQELAHLGVRNFTLVDADVIEATNLNRVAGARLSDVGAAKVDVAARYIRDVRNDAQVECIKGDVMDVAVASQLKGVDFLFGCTDSHGSRAIIQQLAYQYIVPCIDMGVVIAIGKSEVSHIYGRVQMLAPGLACLTCSGLLDANQVRYDMMTAFERQADPYFQGIPEPSPAVMSLNGTVASLAVTMLLAIVANVPSRGRHLLYSGINSTLRNVKAQPAQGCYICSNSGSLARGDSWPLFGRRS